MLNGDGAMLHKAKRVYISSHQIAYEYFIQLRWGVVTMRKNGWFPPIIVNLEENLDIIWHKILILLMKKPKPRELNFLSQGLPTIQWIKVNWGQQKTNKFLNTIYFRNVTLALASIPPHVMF